MFTVTCKVPGDGSWVMGYGSWVIAKAYCHLASCRLTNKTVMQMAIVT